ncbi:uncharacterized protein JCM6883_006571 [Sporobolomyces salmoneus]|uniref:uncharacterized protein n=1 Tax=Sporobolomyces salmoneus TaxID=183962 RepID=UPI0031703A22
MQATVEALGREAIEEFFSNPLVIFHEDEVAKAKDDFDSLEVVARKYGTLLGLQHDANPDMSIKWPPAVDPRFVPGRRERMSGRVGKLFRFN